MTYIDLFYSRKDILDLQIRKSMMTRPIAHMIQMTLITKNWRKNFKKQKMS